jgi:hypothetical protein
MESLALKERIVSSITDPCQPSNRIDKSELFVLFDQSRCRGADFKLCSNVKGVLSIGPYKCKDTI